MHKSDDEDKSSTKISVDAPSFHELATVDPSSKGTADYSGSGAKGLEAQHMVGARGKVPGKEGLVGPQKDGTVLLI